MIRYTLKCANGHSFESWFQSAEAFDRLSSSGMTSCAVCGVAQVEKSIMAPRIGKATAPKPLSEPASVAEQAFRDLRQKIEANSEDVGKDFASEARKIHDGDAPERAIIGQARLKDAKALVDDGINVMPLPFLPTKQSN